MSKKINGYTLSRTRMNFRFENPDKCKSIHSELYMYILDLRNRLGQLDKFGLPTSCVMQLLNIGSYNTYNRAYNDLINFGFIKEIKKSTNQHSSRIIAISIFDEASDKALDKANAIASDKASDKASDIIYKQINKETNKQINKETNKQINNNINEEVEEVVSKTIAYWNSIDKFPNCRKPTKDIYKKMEAILKDYSKQDIEIGFKNYKKDVYSRTEETHGSFTHYIRSYYEFICREKGLRLFINK